MRTLTVEQWRLTDQRLVARFRQEQAGATSGDGYDALKVASRLGVVYLPMGKSFGRRRRVFTPPRYSPVPYPDSHSGGAGEQGSRGAEERGAGSEDSEVKNALRVMNELKEFDSSIFKGGQGKGQKEDRAASGAG